MVAIYVRQSIDKQDSISIETQIELCKKELSSNEDFKIFSDKGFSGKNIDRPEFKALMDMISKGAITKIIVYKLDRISRSITDFSNIMYLLEKNNISFISSSEKFDTSTPTGKAMLYIVMIFAQLERETIAERVRDNYYSRGKTGVWLGGVSPFGYDIKNSTLEQNISIELVKEIYSLYANSDLSLGGIAKVILNENKMLMCNNIKISRILHNPAYVKADADIYHFFKSKNAKITNNISDFLGTNGCLLYGKRNRSNSKYSVYDDMTLSISNHLGAINSDIWLKCQYKLQNNIQIKNIGKGKHTFLTGLVKCGYCGYGMSIKTYKDTKYLNCTGRYITDKCIDKLETHYLKEIEEYIFFEMKIFIKNFKNIKPNADKVNTKINALKIELHKVQDEIESLINSLSFANETLYKYINIKILELDTKKSSLLEKISKKNLSNKSISMPNLSNWDMLTTPIKHYIAKKIINRILIFNNSIKIEWKH